MVVSVSAVIVYGSVLVAVDNVMVTNGKVMVDGGTDYSWWRSEAAVDHTAIYCRISSVEQNVWWGISDFTASILHFVTRQIIDGMNELTKILLNNLRGCYNSEKSDPTKVVIYSYGSY